jgi:hypothetical protein
MYYQLLASSAADIVIEPLICPTGQVKFLIFRKTEMRQPRFAEQLLIALRLVCNYTHSLWPVGKELRHGVQN